MFYRTLIGKILTAEQIARLSDPDWIRANARHIYKDKINILAELTVVIDGSEKLVVIKWFGWRNRISCWLSPFMRSRARKSWDASHNLLKCGVKVPEPVTVYTCRRFGLIRFNFLLTEKVENYALARNLLRNSDFSESNKNLIIAGMAESIRKMHDTGMIHHDLTQGNFLVNNQNPHDVTIVDLNRLKHQLFIRRSLKMYDIAKLNLCNCRLEREHPGCPWITFLSCYDEKEIERNKKALQSALSRRKMTRRLKAMRKSKKPRPVIGK